MGVTLSTQASLAPVSLASTILGFISFAFTLATFLNVFWSSIMTISAAPDEISDYLGGLKQGLYEERAYLRTARKRRRRMSRSHRRRSPYDDGRVRHSGALGEKEAASEEDISMKVTRDSIKHMIRRFRILERPFLQDWDRRERESAAKESAIEEDPGEWYENTYRQCGIRERVAWLRRKKDAVALVEGLSRMQTKRIAKELGEIAIMVREMDQDVNSTDNRLQGLEQRLSRVVGIRRVD